MAPDLFNPQNSTRIPLVDEAGENRSAHEIAREIGVFTGTDACRLETTLPLEASVALKILQALKRPAQNLILPLQLAAVCHKGLIDEAARAGCIGIELRREDFLKGALGNGLLAPSAEQQALSMSLRRARGLGMATIMDLDLGIAGDDEGVFERTMQFLQQSLIAIPRVHLNEQNASPLMTAEGRQNGFDWLQNKLVRHREIWRRALWPSGKASEIMRAGYRQRNETPLETRGHYTTTMHMLRALNRRRKTSRNQPMLPVAPDLRQPPRGAWLEVRAASNSTLRTLEVAVAGTLDLRGARKLLERVGEALQSEFIQVTIDFSGLEWVSLDVINRFIKENQSRFLAMANQAKLVNLQSTVEALRQQLGDTEAVQLLAAAAPARA